MSGGKYTDWYGGKRSQSWRTPPSLFDPLNEEFGFTLDGASEPGNGLLPRASTAEKPLPWDGESVFCNPPWSNIPAFLEMAPLSKLTVFLVPARTNSRWFHRALALGMTPRFFLGRPTFVGGKSCCPVDCLFLVCGAAGVGADWPKPFTGAWPQPAGAGTQP